MFLVCGTGRWCLRAIGHRVSAFATPRNDAASAQAAAKAIRTWQAASVTRAAILSRRKRRAPIPRVQDLWCRERIAQGQQLPIGGGMQDQAHLVGHRGAI